MILRSDKETYSGKNFVGWKYSLGDTEKSSRVVGGSFTKRYPEEGCVMNKECDQYMLFWQGQARIIIDNEIFNIIPGDVIFVAAKKCYFIEQVGLQEVKLWLINEPEFKYEQHINIKNHKH